VVPIRCALEKFLTEVELIMSVRIPVPVICSLILLLLASSALLAVILRLLLLGTGNHIVHASGWHGWYSCGFIKYISD
jgi:hypothetical protein